MPSSADTFSLSSLGHELDAARRSRLGARQSDVESDTDDTLSPLSSPALRTRPVPSPTVRSTDTESPERPYPLCLLCLTRPPSAVLLPCCHLNLCYLCAPLLIMRHRSPSSPPSLSSSPEEPFHIPSNAIGIDLETSGVTPHERPHWSHVLARATASHPKSRRLSMGGYVPPATGLSGGEMTARDLVQPSGQGFGQTGMSRSLGEDGRWNLGQVADSRGVCQAKCLICRAGVQGWLRVYTG
ncbi:hypothetical protein DB88DRAFT_494058 [Papiliotrema laurentii]|uniref:Uncharacterized protein n=1 Tax=Papiliotrema laurentii TaxID=5418 RepID=A0AAD9FPR8_PAPLA|nr:hypothetical protein DB88DRAFT_494058 [Papiliotrema laurentii]